MMMTLLVLKSRIKDFYQKHYRLVRGVIKALLMFGVFLVISGKLDYREALGEYWLMALLALLCGFTPDPVLVLLTVLYPLAEISAVSLFLAAALFLLLLIFLLLFGSLGKYQCTVALSVPLLTALGIGGAVPLVGALFMSPMMLPALITGVLFQYLMEGVISYSASMPADGGERAVFASMEGMFDSILGDPRFYVTAAAFCLCFLCVYLIRRSQVRYAPQIAILVGTILLMAVQLLSNIILNLSMEPGILALQAGISMVIAYVIEFFRMTLDYHGTKKLQFEDDEYYYYVTAVPKFKVAVVDKTVTRIVPEEGETVDLKEELEKALLEEESKKDGD